MEKKSYPMDVPVLLIFFNRPKFTKKVFDQIKKARPSRLYLFQDGPRVNKTTDLENISLCRAIFEKIDWQCEVFKNYQETNNGCFPATFLAHKWMFAKEEFGIVLEDDVVPSLTFFKFCKELLERYKDDERINMICGMNNLGITDSGPNSYFFSQRGSIWGWASWARVVNNWDENYDILDDANSLDLLKKKLGKAMFLPLYKSALKHKNKNIKNFELFFAFSQHLNSTLNIVPAKNMISNIGVGPETTHSVDSLKKIPKATRKLLFMDKHEIEFPLTHPKYIIENAGHTKRHDKLMGTGRPVIQFFRRMESVIYRGLLGDYKSLKNGLKRRFTK